MKRVFLTLSLLLCAALSAEFAENFKLHNIYGDHMVLQRDRDIVITGTAARGKKVTVTLAGNSATAVAGRNGVWKAVLPAMSAGGPHTLTVSGKKGAQRTLEDVMIGEVWLCSGQSNMAFVLRDAFNWQAECDTAKNLPDLRLFDVNRRVSFGKKLGDIESAGWDRATPNGAKWFSAIGFLFGRELQKSLGVPVGIINSSWGGTAIEPWISRQAFDSNGFKIEAQLAAKKPAVDYQKLQQLKGGKQLAWQAEFFKRHQKESAAAARWQEVNIPDENKWQNVYLPLRFSDFRVYTPAVLWFRKSVDVPPEMAGRDLELSLGFVDDCDETFFNGYPVGSNGMNKSQPRWIPRRYKIPGYLVKAGKNLIAVRVINFAEAGGFHTKERNFYLADEPRRIMLAGKDWKMRVEFKLKGKFAPSPREVYDTTKNHPSGIYNASIAGLQRFPVRGVLWYQGEGNAHRAERYAKRFATLINSWRKEWNDPQMPFIFAQLSSLEKHAPGMKIAADFYEKLAPRASNWAALREAQTAALSLPATDMVVTTDVGNPVDIHPRDKQTVAKRMHNAAMKMVYGRKELLSTPVMKSVKRSGKAVIVEFTNSRGGLIAKGDKLRRFALAGKDGIFHWAEAVIDGEKVIVSSEKVSDPTEIRYAWDNNPIDANLFNKAGLPASGFRAKL